METWISLTEPLREGFRKHIKTKKFAKLHE